MKGRNTLKKIKSLALVSLLFPVVAFAANYESVLKNKSDPHDGFYLVQSHVWGDEGCVLADDLKKGRINPNDDVTLKIKKSCEWGGVRYDVYKISNEKKVGSLSHSFRDGGFSIEVSANCDKKGCNFYDLDPRQNRKSK